MPIVTIDAVKTYLQISVTTYDDLIDALIPPVEADYLKIRGVPFDLHDNLETNYPDDAQLTASLMIGYHVYSDSKGAGKKSESIGSYSYTGEDIEEGYPKSTFNRIERFQKLK